MRAECCERSNVARLIRNAGNAKSLQNAIAIHDSVLERGFLLDRYLSNLLVDMYGKCGGLEHARSVFTTIQHPNIFSWNILLEANARNGQLREAKVLFDGLCHRDVWTWTALVSAFSHSGCHLSDAESAFERMPRRDAVSTNVFLSALAQAGRVRDAEALLDQLPCPTTVSWTCMLEAYAQHGDFLKMGILFNKMPHKDIVAWIVVMAAFARVGDLQTAKNIFDCMPEHSLSCYNTLTAAMLNDRHNEDDSSVYSVRRMLSAFPESDLVSWNTMLCAYARHGYNEELTNLFQSMSSRNMVSWDTLLYGMAKHGSLQQAADVFCRMPGYGAASWTCMISVQANAGQLEQAKNVFDNIPEGQADIISWNCIMLAYARCLDLPHNITNENVVDSVKIVEKMFRNMPAVNVVSHNVCLALYAKCRRVTDAWHLFQGMPQQDSMSWGTMVSAFACVGDMEMARETLKRMPQQHTVPCNAVLAGYAYHGNVDEACSWFDAIPMKDIVTWNSLVAAYAKSDAKCNLRAAVALFAKMDLAGLPLNAVSFLNVLEAYTKLADDALARSVHTSISMATTSSSCIKDRVAVGNALINMYGKCGCIKEAASVFNNMRQTSCLSTVTWNTMILANATKGHGEKSLTMFQEMNLEGWIPDKLALVAALIGTSRMGSIDTARQLFVTIKPDFGMQPTAAHCFCMVDALARAGRLENAQELLCNMPFEPDSVGWKALLAASNTQGDVAKAVDYAISAIVLHLENSDRLAVEDSFPYVQLSNVYVHNSF